MSRLSTCRRIPDRWFDVVLAAAAFVAFEAEVLTSQQAHGPRGLNVLVVAAITLATAWRRRRPLAFACVVMGLGLVMTATLTDVTSLSVPLYLLFVPAYTVAAYEDRNRAVLGLAVCVAVPWAMDAVARPGRFMNYVFTAGMSAAAWAVGRALPARRQLNAELERTTQRIAAERESRERLAIADERTRIARELHAVVAGTVSAMVVQTEVAEQLLDEDLSRADEAMAAVEAAGRQALVEMRRILGVLRHAGDAPELAPQPGVGQIHQLVNQARRDHKDVEYEVDGDVGPLPSSVDLGLYRILEEALATVGATVVEVRLTFEARDVVLEVTADGGARAPWPTPAMRERVALCDGELDYGPGGLQVRLPRSFEDLAVA